MRKIVFYIVACLLLCTCIRRPSLLEQALTLAGDNRAALDSVLAHYAGEPQKLAAARFLIENMPGKYAEDDRPATAYATLFDEWIRLRQLNNAYISRETSDSLTLAFGLTSSRRRLYDLEHIRASYLIRNVDRAFEAWTTTPWGRDIPFDVFCHEILPYRLENEPLEDWRDIVLAQYRPLYDSLRTSGADVITACLCVFEAMGLDWDSINKTSPLLPPSSYSMIDRVRTGPCTERVKYGVFVMRAFGLPVNWDYTPQWPFRSLGHDWASLRAGEGRYIPFIPTELKPGEPHKPDHRMAKAYRHTYAINRQSQAVVAQTTDLPDVFRNVCMSDVSALTFTAADIVLEAGQLTDKTGKYLYLAVFDNQRWVPIAWAKRGRQTVFADMGKDIAYLPVSYQNGTITATGLPFILTREAKIRWLQADTTRRQTLTLVRKHPFQANWHVKMAGGQFQGASRPDFADATVLYTITNDPDFYYCDVAIDAPADGFRYCRYLSPPGGKGHIAEIEFYAGADSQRVDGKIIGTPGSYQGMPSRTIQSVFDGDVLTFFDAPRPDSAWVGMDFGHPVRITKIRYLPRNDDNIIVPGQLYELFYWANDGWKSLGRQTATGYMLDCVDAPTGALFLLRNLTKGKEERIFTYEEGKQVWW